MPAEYEGRYRYHVATYDCSCGVGSKILVDEVHYDLGKQFQGFVKGALEIRPQKRQIASGRYWNADGRRVCVLAGKAHRPMRPRPLLAVFHEGGA
jgi:hypothetical protein